MEAAATSVSSGSPVRRRPRPGPLATPFRPHPALTRSPCREGVALPCGTARPRRGGGRTRTDRDRRGSSVPGRRRGSFGRRCSTLAARRSLPLAPRPCLRSLWLRPCSSDESAESAPASDGGEAVVGHEGSCCAVRTGAAPAEHEPVSNVVGPVLAVKRPERTGSRGPSARSRGLGVGTRIGPRAHAVAEVDDAMSRLPRPGRQPGRRGGGRAPAESATSRSAHIRGRGGSSANGQGLDGGGLRRPSGGRERARSARPSRILGPAQARALTTDRTPGVAETSMELVRLGIPLPLTSSPAALRLTWCRLAPGGLV